MFSVLIGLASTLWGYRYGDGNQIEQLPIVLRAINPSYLSNDFFTNATQDYGPRALFADFVALLDNLVGGAGKPGRLAGIYLALTILGNVGIAFVTARFARDLFDGSDLAGLIAAAAVMTLKSFWLGYSNVIYDYFLEPAHLAMPFILLAIWAGLRQRPAASVLTAGIAALFHPLMGLETGALMLGVMAVTAGRQQFWGAGRRAIDSASKAGWMRLGASGLAFAGFAALILVPYASSPPIDASQFIKILAFFRHPHHYVPSGFGAWQYLQAIVFLIPMGITWNYALRNSSRLKSASFPMVTMATFLALLCLGGYLFVEVFPSRLWTTAQTFRLLFMIKWLGLVMTAGWVGCLLETAMEEGSWPFVMLVSLISQVTLFMTFTVHLVRKWAHNRLSTGGKFAIEGMALVLMAPILLVFPPDARIYVLFPLFSLMALALSYRSRLWLALTVDIGLTSVVIVVLLLGNHFLPSGVMAFVNQPVVTLSQLSGDDIDLAAFVKANTPADAIFLTPPTLGEFRYTAERAIVVDFDAFPFQDQAMVEWQQRIFDCYGIPDISGFDAVTQMRNHYKALNRADLLQLQSKYGFTYAVIYTESQTDFPVLFRNGTYQLVKITG